jgi:hypothetical protein
MKLAGFYIMVRSCCLRQSFRHLARHTQLLHPKQRSRYLRASRVCAKGLAWLTWGIMRWAAPSQPWGCRSFHCHTSVGPSCTPGIYAVGGRQVRLLLKDRTFELNAYWHAPHKLVELRLCIFWAVKGSDKWNSPWPFLPNFEESLDS